MIPIYPVVQEFLRIEAIGTWGASSGVPTDPIRINAYVTPSSNIAVTVESRDTNKPEDKDSLYRLSVGKWALKLNPALYVSGQSYTANFRFWSTPSNVNVLRQTFIWDPVNELPRQPAHCIVFGSLCDTAGIPVPDQYLVAERYRNLVTLNERESQVSVKTNTFGIWSIELPINAVIRFVFGNISKIVKVPDQSRASLGELPDYQPVPAQADKFGYPFPIGA